MAAAHPCLGCGQPLEAGVLSGLCPHCVARVVLAEPAPSAVGEGERKTTTALHRDGGPPNSFAQGRFGNYELIEEIGRGGMGVVYRARQVGLNRFVALKLLPPGPFASEELIARFHAEAQAAACLQHPNIVRIHEVGEHRGQHYYSMDLVEGQNLAEVARSSPLPPSRAARYVRIIAEAMQYAHEQRVLHRDLKPSNILIDQADQPCITDFGLAKRLTAESDLTLSGQVLGSPGFLSPEQASGRHNAVGPASDLYGLGAILYYLLTGRPPFRAETLTELFRSVLHDEPVPPRTWHRSIPRDLETICLKCLQKEPWTRYASARALAEDLERWSAGKPILARPLGWFGRLGRWCHRHPIPAAVTATLALVSLAFLGIAGAARISLWRLERADELLYVSTGSDVFLSDSAGTTWRPLPILGVNLDVSPDGRRLCYSRAQHIYVSRLDGSGEKEVVGSALQSRWLDPRTLIYQPVDLGEVWSVEFPGGTAQKRFAWRNVTPDGIAGGLSLSPDRTHLVVNPQNGFYVPTQDLLTCDVNGRNAHVVWADDPDTIMDAFPFWLPGDRVVWCRFARPGVEAYDSAIVTCRLGDTHYRALTDWEGFKYPVAVSPDGSRVLFVKTVRGKGGHLELWSMNADGTNARRFIDQDFPRGGAGVIGAAWYGRPRIGW